MSVVEKLNEISAKIPTSVTLVAVSKTHPVERIEEAYRCGQRIFGENRPQELVGKYQSMPKDIQWHMIGSLQTNKVKLIAPFVAMIHSVDSQRLLEAINKEAVKCGRVIDVLMEVFIADEQTKHGWSEQELMDYLATGAYQSLEGVRIVGVMGMATYTDNITQVRNEFAHLKVLFTQLKTNYFAQSDSFKEISMGMSSDFEIAIEQGSTMVRVGSSIFGSR